jgi:hypothetical protein
MKKHPVIKDKALKHSLIAYLQQADDERLWQAIRTWSGFAFVLVADYAPEPPQDALWTNVRDTFALEGTQAQHTDTSRGGES